MMMRYLGLGIGHLHAFGFPTEVNALKFVREEGGHITSDLAEDGDGDEEEFGNEAGEEDDDRPDGLVQFEY